MNTKKTRLLSILFAFILSMTGVDAFAHAIEVTNNDGVTIYYSWLNNQTELAVSYRGGSAGHYEKEYTGDVVIPATVTYNGTTYRVTSIKESAFQECSGLTSVTIPNSVTSIGNYAFCKCSGLTSVTIPNSVTTIDYYAFSQCTKLTTVVIGNLVANIGNYAFSYCSNLTSLVIGNSVTSIGEAAFSGCGLLTSVTIPSSVTTIGNYAFSSCSGLTSVTVEKDTPLAISTNTFSNRYNATLYVPAGCKTAYKTANIWKDFKEIVEMEAVSPSITFADANVKAICVQNWDTNGDGELSEAEAAAVTDLGTTFQNKRTITSFDELQYFTGLTSIGQSTFNGCSGLTSVIIPNSVTSIGSNAFYECSLTSVTIPSSVTFIDEFAFTYCSNLTSILVGGGNINYDSRDNCNAIIETNSNTLIAGCKNTIIPNSVTSIGDYAFEGCSGLTSVTIPNSVTSIGTSAFSDCSLTSVTIPSSVASIGGSAFRYCHRLTSVTIPNSVNTIGQMAFSGCSYLNRVNISDLAAWCNIAFEDEDANPLTYAHHLYDEYGEITYLDIPDNVTSIGEYAFSGCIGLTGLTIPNSVTRIGGNAFNGCTNLTSVTIPNSVTNIGEGAFYNCSSLTSVTVEMETPPTIKSYTFSNRTNATLYVPAGCKAAYQAADYWKEFKQIVEPSPAITFADANVKALCVQNWDTNGDGELSEAEAAAVTNLGEVFKGNTTITSFDELQYFTGLTTIGDYAFYSCEGLTSVTIPNSVTSIGDYAFDNCTSLNPLTIPNTVTSIGQRAFHGCASLTSVTIPNSVTSIGDYAFDTCFSLASIIVESDNINYDSRDNCNAIIETSTNKLIVGCKNTVIPNSVTIIGKHAFFYKGPSQRSLIIPNSVTIIEVGAFRACGLTSVTIPNSVTSIEGDAFHEYGPSSVKVYMENPLTICSDTFDPDNATLYVPKGSKAAYQAANYWSEFKAIKEFPDSDVNQDGEIDMMDVVDIARFVVGTPAETFVEFLADLNNNGEVNVADAVVLVNEIVGDQNFAKAFGAPRQDLSDDRLTLTKNDDHSLSFSMESQRNYTAFQFDLYTNSEDDAMGLRLNNARKHGHQLIYNKVDEGHYRVVALSVANNTFNGSNGELLNIQLDGFNATDMTISNIHFITTDGTDYRFDDLTMSGATGIEGLTPNPSPKEEGNVYDLSGRKVSEPSVLPKGVYIMNGKKVIVK